MVRTRLQKRSRTAARIALYGSFVLVGLGVASVYPFVEVHLGLGLDQKWYKVDFEAMPEVRLLQELVRVDTTPESGDEVAAAELMAQRIRAAGIPVLIEHMGDRKANLYAILEGESPEAVVLHNHLDVDPVPDPERWEFPPFDGVIDPPWIYGRGVFDMKSIAAAQLQAFLALKAEGSRPRRSVMFLATSSEETGSDWGTRWLLRERPELVARMWAVLTEGGVLEATSRTDVKYWGTEFAQKRFVNILACSPSRRRLEVLLEDLLDRGRQWDSLRVVPAVKTFLDTYAATRANPQYRDRLHNPEALIRRPDLLARFPRYVQALFRDEVHPFPIQARAQGYEMRISLHLLPDSDLDAVLSRLLPEWMVHGVALEVVDPTPATVASSTSHPAFVALSSVLKERFGEIPQGPFFIPFSATDARFFRSAGIPAYGFTPFLILSSDSLTMSGVDEQLALPAYLDGVELYIDLVRRLANVPDGGGAE